MNDTQTTSGIPKEILDRIDSKCSALAAALGPYLDNSLALDLHTALLMTIERCNAAD